MSDVIINELELASELANEDVINKQNESISINSQEPAFSNGIVTDDGDTIIYTEEAQEFFNERYDYYLSVIEKVRV